MLLFQPLTTSVSVLNLETAILLSKTNSFGNNTGRLYLN